MLFINVSVIDRQIMKMKLLKRKSIKLYMILMNCTLFHIGPHFQVQINYNSNDLVLSESTRDV